MLPDSRQPLETGDAELQSPRERGARTGFATKMGAFARVGLQGAGVCVVTGGAFLAGRYLALSPGDSDVAAGPVAACSNEDPWAYLNDASLDELYESKVPESFDVREQWLGCGHFNVDQGQCGDCWAASGTHTLADRACVHLTADRRSIPLSSGGAGGLGAVQRLFSISGRCVGVGSDALAHKHGCKRGIDTLSPQKLVSCCNPNFTSPPTFHPDVGHYKPGKSLYPGANGCNGGWPENAWRFFYHEGLTSMDTSQTKGCTPYTSGQCSGKDPNNNGCRTCTGFDQCSNTGLEPEVTTVDSFGFIMESDIPARQAGHTDKPRPVEQWPAMARQARKMQIEMLVNGPLHVCVDIYSNFQAFFNEQGTAVYNNTESTPMAGAHCIELVGWGVDRLSGLPYWTFKNSWAHDWAVAGFGRILRGVDFLGIESDVWAGCPSGSNCQLTPGVVRYEHAEPGHASPPTPDETTQQVYREEAFSAAEQNIQGATAQRHPSRQWNGGAEIELSREAFSHSSLAPLVAAAVRQCLNEPDMSTAEALTHARTVWSRSLRGIRLRVLVDGCDGDFNVHHHPHGHTEIL